MLHAEWKKPLYTSLALLLALALFVYSPLKQWQYSEAMSWITAVSLIITLYPAVYFLLYGSSATETESDTAMLPLVDFLNHNTDREVRFRPMHAPITGFWRLDWAYLG